MGKFGVRIEADNREEVMSKVDKAMMVALEAVGLEAEGDVKKLVPVDTGLLRNSITHAVDGKPPAITTYTSESQHKKTPATERAGTAGKAVDPPKSGKYDSSPVSPGGDGIRRAYVGTNVEYAP